MIDTILGWIGSFLGWLDGLTGNYVWALFIFAIIVEILLLPFAIKQQKNTIKQAKLRPKELAIRKKYAGRTDRQTQMKVSEEIQAMYQKEGYSPFSGCLPLLIQMPIILALYNVVIDPLKHVLHVSSESISAMQSYITAGTDAGGLGLTLNSSRGTIELISVLKEKGIEAFEGVISYVDAGSAGLANPTLSGQQVYDSFVAVSDKLPDFNVFGINLGQIPSPSTFNILWIIPVLTFAVYFASMKLNRLFSYQPTNAQGQTDAQTGCSNNVMDVMMPLMSTWIAFIVPAAVGVYWIFKSMIGTLKQFIMSKAMPIPTFTEEELREAEKEYAAKPEKKKNKGSVNFDAVKRNPNSLFSMDEEDYVPPVKDEEEVPQIKTDDSGAISKAPLKDDRKHDDKNEK